MEGIQRINSVHRRFLSSAQKVLSFVFRFLFRRVHCSTEGLYKMMTTPIPVIQIVSTVNT